MLRFSCLKFVTTKKFEKVYQSNLAGLPLLKACGIKQYFRSIISSVFSAAWSEVENYLIKECESPISHSLRVMKITLYNPSDQVFKLRCSLSLLSSCFMVLFILGKDDCHPSCSQLPMLHGLYLLVHLGFSCNCYQNQASQTKRYFVKMKRIKI